MRDTSLLDVIRHDRKRRKNKLVRRFLVGIPLALIAVISVSALADTSPSQTVNKPDVSAVTDSATPPPNDASQNNNLKPAVDETNQVKPITSNSPPDYSAINATLCNDMKNTVQAQNESYLTQYADNQKYWLDLYRGAYDSQEATESKQFYINYTKGRFNELKNSSGPSLQKTCNSTVTITDILKEPNYTAW